MSVISSLVSKRLLDLRRKKNLRVSEVARRAGLPVSSYSCLERGYYALTVDNLFRILGALEADVCEVWPRDSEGSLALGRSLYVKRIQEFRLAEVVNLSGSEGAALFSVVAGKASTMTSIELSDFMIDRLLYYLQDGLRYEPGLWFSHWRNDYQLWLYLKADSCPRFVSSLIRRYMVIWSAAWTVLIEPDGPEGSTR